MMDFEYTLPHPKGEIKVKVTGATANAAVATVQMGHEIVAMMGGNVAGQAPVEIAPDEIADVVDTTEPVYAAPLPVTVEVAGLTSPNKTPDVLNGLDSAGTPFDPELHTGTLKKDGTWRLKKGAASKVEEAEDEGEPEGNEVALAGVSTETTSNGADTAGSASSPEPAAPSSSTASGDDEELPDITDTELQRYCGRLVQHFGSSEPVFALAAEFVPDGDMPRPTAIKDQTKRREFVAKAQEQTGVKYHG